MPISHTIFARLFVRQLDRDANGYLCIVHAKSTALERLSCCQKSRFRGRAVKFWLVSVKKKERLEFSE